ncbi:BPSS1780 family membrane protein [Paraburkholderia acidipaludis]|uniref:BPSS1780 family membrane protein n=1 Tax=Paraburkholderia acidipaludis TaxID=660537 RepID=UPI000481FB37|nr:BPSS1780 family membrane protein [Paraburkholderia acidipaludis]
MQLIEVPAKAGYVWFRQGIWLFRRNPLAFLTLFFAYLLAMTLISAIPVVGGVLPLLFVPGVAVGFMAACRDTVAGKPVFPTILIDGFRAYGSVVTKRLFALGVIYVVAMTLVLAASALADGGTLLQLMTLGGTLDTDTLENSNVPLAVLASLVLYVPVSMLFWFAPVLTAWHDVPPVKAMFFSVVSCWRNKGAFVVYGALWMAVSVAVSVGLSVLLHALDAGGYGLAVLMPALIVLLTMLYCSFYATYRGCFGVQDPQTLDAAGR